MNPERKAEVNRRLAEFDGWKPGQPCPGRYLNPCSGVTTDWQGWRKHLPHDIEHADYVTDLNALARLETKLPPHFWQILYESHPRPLAMFSLYNEPFEVGARCHHSADGETEAEARAEAVVQYLETCEKSAKFTAEAGFIRDCGCFVPGDITQRCPTHEG